LLGYGDGWIFAIVINTKNILSEVLACISEKREIYLFDILYPNCSYVVKLIIGKSIIHGILNVIIVLIDNSSDVHSENEISRKGKKRFQLDVFKQREVLSNCIM
jgi:hypothetical protein